MKRSKLVLLLIDGVLRVAIAVLFVMAWLSDDYAQAGVLVGLMVVFQLNDIWRELKSQRRPTHQVTINQPDRDGIDGWLDDINTEAVNQ